jgi:hypothetical protein
MAKLFRRISLRYEKLAVTYRASISIDTAPHIHSETNLQPRPRPRRQKAYHNNTPTRQPYKQDR